MSPVLTVNRKTERGRVPPRRHAQEADGADVAPVGLALEQALARDQTLLRRWRDGDATAGLELLGHYRRLFYRTCLRFGLRQDEAMLEVLQEVVLQLLERLADLPERLQRSFGGFFYWLVRDTVRRHRRAEAVELLAEDVEPAGSGPTLDLRDAIEQCRCKLAPREREVFDLRYLKGMSLKETAAELDSNVNAVGQAIFRLTGKMRECLRRTGF
jgi:RNA polymerase sigma factor (sigma-70 family)